MDIEKVVSEITNQTGVRLRSDDPVVTTVLLNKIILGEYIRDLEGSLNESITNVAVKENVTMDKLRNLLSDQQVKQNKDIERVYNKFIDNLTTRLSTVQVGRSLEIDKNTSSVWGLSIAFLFGLLIGGISVYLV